MHPADLATLFLLQRAEIEWDFANDRPKRRMDRMYETAMRQALKEYGRLAADDEEGHVSPRDS